MMDTKAVSSGASTASTMVSTPTSADAAKAQKGAAVSPAAVPPAAAPAATKAPSNYDVKISSDGKDRAAAQAKALEIARGTPDIREDRVAAIKAQVDAGTYQIDSGKIADGMLHEAIRDHLAEGNR